MKDLEKYSAIELGKEVNKKNISPLEVIKYFISRIEKRNKSINAFVYLNFDEAIKEAKILEKRLMSGENIGEFAGVPIALKDFLPTKIGWPTSHGGVKSLIKIDKENSIFYETMKNLGAISIGKTNAPSFGFRATCENKLFGSTKNPFNLDYNSGGSSGGSASALCDGLVLLAEGTDGGGSIRVPASWCNLFGFKASSGLIPNICYPDAWAASHPFCTSMALTKNILDSAKVLNYMSRFNSKDPYSYKREFFDYSKLENIDEKDIKNLKIGFTYDFNIFPYVDDEIKTSMNKIFKKLFSLGIKIDEIDFKINRSLKELTDAWCFGISIDSTIEINLLKEEGFDLIKDHSEELPEDFIYWYEKVKDFNLIDYYELNKIRTEILYSFENVFDKYDVIFSPTTICLPLLNDVKRKFFKLNEVLNEEINPLIGFGETFLANFSGHPAASIPIEISKNNLPIGMQIISKKFCDEDIFKIAFFLEKINPWNYDIPFNREISEKN